MLQVLGLARVGFCIADLDGVIQSADKLYSDIMHYDNISSGALGVTDVALPEDVGRLTDAMRRVSTSGSSLIYRRPAVCGDGDIIWVENRLSMLESAHAKSFLVATREIDKPKTPERSSGLHFPARTCAAYVADLSGELSLMASESNLTLTADMLRFAAELVQAEVETLAGTMEVMAH